MWGSRRELEDSTVLGSHFDFPGKGGRQLGKNRDIRGILRTCEGGAVRHVAPYEVRITMRMDGRYEAAVAWTQFESE
jgi:hypothetical protein